MNGGTKSGREGGSKKGGKERRRDSEGRRKE